MPFRPELDPIRDIVVAAGQSLGVDIERSDSIFRPGVVLDQVLKAIDAADLVVAVCTGKDDLPFDVQHFRTKLYGGISDSQSLATLEERVRRAIQAVLGAS